MRHSSQKNVTWLRSVGIAIFCLHVSAATSRTTEQLIDEVVIRKWEDYERFARKLQGKVHSTTISLESGSEKEQQGWAVYKQNQKCVLWSRGIGDENLTELITIANAQYTADLKRSGTSLGDVVLQRFSETDEQPKRGEPPVIKRVLSSVSPHFYLHNKIPLSRILDDPRLKIQKMSRIIENGRELVRMDYRAVDELQPSARLRHVFVNSGSVDLDPSQCWCIVRTKVSEEFTTNDEPITYKDTEEELSMIVHPSGFPLVNRITSLVKQHHYKYRDRKERKIDYRFTMDFEWEVNDSVPDSEFTLTAYGLPEPGGEPVKKTLPPYVWIILATAICIGLAVGFRFLSRRARSEPAG